MGQLLLMAAYVLAGWSLLHFALASIKVLWPILIVLGLNVIGTLLSSLTSFNTRRVSAKTHRALVEGWAPSGPVPSIDVFLPTYGEDVAVLRNTYTHVKAMEAGRVEVHVLDDGDRGEVRDLAAQSVRLRFVRPNRGHLKKAGNLQYAFARTSGDHIVILDADFCPRPDFLRHLVPYMDDPAVGIVQSPQYFDSGENLNWIQRTAGSTQELFYLLILPSRDRFNAAICVGTCALYRRKALEATGGFAQIEHSEDIHTGLHLMQAGFQTRYVPIVVSRGLCPGTWRASSTSSTGGATGRWSSCTTRSLTASGENDPAATALLLGGLVLLHHHRCQRSGALPSRHDHGRVFPDPSPARTVCALPRRTLGVSGRDTGGVQEPLAVWRSCACRWPIATPTIASCTNCGRSAGWVPTGAVNRPNPLARSISRLGAVAIILSLVPFWASSTTSTPMGCASTG